MAEFHQLGPGREQVARTPRRIKASGLAVPVGRAATAWGPRYPQLQLGAGNVPTD